MSHAGVEFFAGLFDQARGQGFVALRSVGEVVQPGDGQLWCHFSPERSPAAHGVGDDDPAAFGALGQFVGDRHLHRWAPADLVDLAGLRASKSSRIGSVAALQRRSRSVSVGFLHPGGQSGFHARFER